MEVLKHIAVNLAVLVLLSAVMVPPAMSEGQLGRGSFLGGAFILSAVMTVVSSFAYGVGTRSRVIVRCAGAVVVLWFLFSMTMFIIFEKPAFLQDVRRYWFGAAACAILLVLQAIYDRKHVGAMLGLCDLD